VRIPLSHQAQQRIREYIQDHDLTPGDALPSEGEFCRMLEMSKATVREGIRRLELLGVVEVRHGLGLFAGQFSLDPVLDALPYQLRVDDTPLHEILQIRAAIEEGLIVQASQAMTSANLDALDALVDEMRSTSRNGEVPPDVDRAFHLAVFEPLGNVLLDRLINTFWEIYARFPAIEKAPINHHAVEDHAEIVAALRSGDHERMTRAVAVHFAPIQSTVELSAGASLEEDRA
jgi:DNA-binding FadR family transcriptional regulator